MPINRDCPDQIGSRCCGCKNLGEGENWCRCKYRAVRKIMLARVKAEHICITPGLPTKERFTEYDRFKDYGNGG